MSAPRIDIPEDIPPCQAARLRAWRAHSVSRHKARVAAWVVAVLLPAAILQWIISSAGHAALSAEGTLLTGFVILAGLTAFCLWFMSSVDFFDPTDDPLARARVSICQRCVPWRPASIGQLCALAGLAQAEPWLPRLVANSVSSTNLLPTADAARLLRLVEAAAAARTVARERAEACAPLDTVICACRAEAALLAPPAMTGQRCRA